MQLTFEEVAVVGTGNYPDFVQFERTEGEIFFLDNGLMYGTPSEKLDGIFSDPVWQDTHNVTPADDTGLTNLELKTLSGFGIVGSYTTPTAQKLIIYEFQHDISEYLNMGSVSHSISDPISKFTLTLENPDIKDPERPGNIAVNEKTSLLSPGAKVIFGFTMGDDQEEVVLGTFYVDRSRFDVKSENANVNGRNKIGKVLKDQTVDELNEYWLKPVSNTIVELFQNAKLQNDEYIVQNSAVESWFGFTPDTNFYKAVTKIFEVLQEWKIKELEDGTIVVGENGYSAFGQPSTYSFQRGQDIFSREIVRDDAEVYRRVCVHTNEFALSEYRDVAEFQGWNLQTNKTLYVEVSEGTSVADMATYADELAIKLSNVGKVESFNGPFRPYLQIGDSATIIESDGSTGLGLITELTHEFGKDGFYTIFTVDSGGELGTGQVGDYIKKITGKKGEVSTVGKSPIDSTSYMNLATAASVRASSERNRMWASRYVIDGSRYIGDATPQDRGWQPDPDDSDPYIKLDLGKQCLIDKIMLWLDYDGTTPEAMPEYYKIEYWDSRQWVSLLTQSSGIDFEMTHTFTPVETTAIRFTLEQKTSGRQNWREIEVWGNM